MTQFLIYLAIAAIAWGSGWLYGSAGAWNEGYEYGRATMQLLLKGHPVTAEKVRQQLPHTEMPDNTHLYKTEKPLRTGREWYIGDAKPSDFYDYDEMTPQPFKNRLSMIQGGKK